MKATPTKLRTGAWGVTTQGTPRVGETVTVTTKSGKSWTATIDRVIWSGSGVSICATSSGVSAPVRSSGVPAPVRRGRRECVSDGNCSSFGAGRSCGGHDCDGF